MERTGVEPVTSALQSRLPRPPNAIFTLQTRIGRWQALQTLWRFSRRFAPLRGVHRANFAYLWGTSKRLPIFEQ